MDSAETWRAVRGDESGTRHALGLFPGFSVNPVALNDRGDVVGGTGSRSFFGPRQAVLWRRMEETVTVAAGQ